MSVFKKFFRNGSIIFLFIVLSLNTLSCSGGGGDTNNGSDVVLTGTVQADPDDPSAAGEEAGATVYIIGQEANAVQTDENGNFELGVDTGVSGTVLSTPGIDGAAQVSGEYTYGLVVLSAAKGHGRKIEATVTGGQQSSLDTIYITKIGWITGRVTLENATDHSGITVYIPGTSFIAMTDANGNYTIGNVPEGTYDLVRAEKVGSTYTYAAVADVAVSTDATTTLPDMVLLLSSGPNGAIQLNRGDAFTSSTTVEVAIAPSSNAVLMQISENNTFDGLSWEPVQGTKEYTFSGDHSAGGTATLYAKFAEASGLESSPVSDSIYIDTDPHADLVSPVSTTANTKPTLDWDYPTPMPGPKYHVQLNSSQTFASPLVDVTDLANSEYTLTTALDQGTYYWRVAIIDGQGTEWNWAGPWSFTIDLSTVTLISPANGSVINKAANDAGITFSWDANANATSYILTICYDDANVTCGDTYTSTTTSKAIPTLVTADGTYYWAVTPVDANGISGTRSDIWSFNLDTVGPGVLTTVPADLAPGVSKLSLISATFDEPVDWGTIDSASFTLNDGTSNITGNVSYDPVTRTAVLAPSRSLKFNALHTATIASTVKDVPGNPMSGDKVWTFTTSNDVESWAFVDGVGIDGMNKDTTKHAYYPHLIGFNTKLYAAWVEDNGTADQVRVAVYNGDDVTPGWTFVDGNGVNGINKDPSVDTFSPYLAVFNGKLYAAWREYSGTTGQIRVSVYNGNDAAPAWTFADGNGTVGINKDASAPAYYPQLTVFNAKLYVTWIETNATANQIRMAVYNGNDIAPVWTFIDGNGIDGINKDVTKTASSSRLVVFNSKLYATWSEFNGTAYQIRMVVYNGNDGSPVWTFVDGNGVDGINKDAAMSASVPQLTAFNSKLYATWMETNGTAHQIRMVVYNGNDGSPVWTFVDGDGVNGINKDVASPAFDPQLTAFKGKLYALWRERYGVVTQIRVAVYNGDDITPGWTFVDGDGVSGINKDVALNTYYPFLTVCSEKLYAIWAEGLIPIIHVSHAQ